MMYNIIRSAKRQSNCMRYELHSLGQGVQSGENGDLLTLMLTFVLPTMTLMMKRVCSVAGGQVLAEGGGNGRQEVPQAYSTLAVDDDGHDDDDIYIMMKCLSVCVSRQIITSSWEAPVTTCNHP